MKFFSSIETVVQSPLPSSSLQPPPSSSLEPSNEESTPYENEEQVMPITEKTRKRKRKAHEKFAAAVKAQTGLDLHSAMDMGLLLLSLLNFSILRVGSLIGLSIFHLLTFGSKTLIKYCTLVLVLNIICTML